MSDLEKREIQFTAVQDRGEALVLQHHPASKTIEAYMSAMQSQWAWLLQLTLCLDVHLKHASQSQQFFKEVQQSEQWITKKDELLNSAYSQSEFSLDEGERLLKGMQELREELNNYGDQVHRLVEQAKKVVPMKQRRQPVARALQVTCICSYKQVNVSILTSESSNAARSFDYFSLSCRWTLKRTRSALCTIILDESNGGWRTARASSLRYQACASLCCPRTRRRLTPPKSFAGNTREA